MPAMQGLDGLVGPHDAWLRQADRAHARGDTDQAFRLWGAYRVVYPNVATGTLAACAALRMEERFEAARTLAEAALRRGCDDERRVRIEVGRSAEASGDYASALACWQALAVRFPNHAQAHAAIVRVLLKLGRVETARACLADAAARFPGDAALERLVAQVAASASDWAGALRHCEELLARHPHDQAAQRARGIAEWHLNLESREAGAEGEIVWDDTAARVAVGRVADPQAHALVMQFESIGDNCEFGLVQRRFGAEPLGLLRWANVSPPVLVQLLDSRFDGIADLENLDLHRTPHGEYWLKDTRFNLHFHTFVSSEVADSRAFVAKHAARLRWLRDKMRADLEEGCKTLVYKGTDGLTERAVAGIVKALRRVSPAKLLCVTKAPPETAGGCVNDCGDGVLRGALSMTSPVGRRWDINFDEWLSLCTAASVC